MKWLACIVTSLFASLSFQAQAQAYGDSTVVPYGDVDCAAPLDRIINVPDAFIIQDLDFEFIAEHGWRTDTNLTITSPTGTSAALLTGNYGDNHDNYVVRFDDEAGVVVDTGIHDDSQLLTDPILPVQSEGDPLSVFDGEQAQGDWIISVCDVFTTADGGNMNRIELFFTGPPDLQASKNVTVFDPGGLGLYAVPGNDVIYTLSITNAGIGAADSDTIVLIDALPGEIEFYNADIDDGGPELDPVSFSDMSSGLTFTYGTDVAFSNAVTRPADFAACTYTPLAGYDPSVTHVCLNPKGAFQAGAPDPTASFSFRVRLK